jgi:hypothetical protein
LFYSDAPEIEPGQNKVATDSDRSLTAEFHCYLSAIPKPTIIWLKVSFQKLIFFIKMKFLNFKDNQTLPISSKYQSILNDRTSSSSNLLFDAILYVSNITKSDYGIYQCKAENPLGMDLIEIILTGLSKWLFISSSSLFRNYCIA